MISPPTVSNLSSDDDLSKFSSKDAVENDKLSIVFEHEDFYAIHKPCNVLFHNEMSDEGDLSLGIVSLVSDLFMGEKLYPTHRLDRVTSGIMIFARNQRANSEISSLFEQRKMSKTYIAITAAKPKTKCGTISGGMEKKRNGTWALTQSAVNQAVTRFDSSSCYPHLKKHWLLCLKPLTGKTHQLRVAAKSLGAPIKGDNRYGGGLSDRCYLHAFNLSFIYQDTKIDLFDLNMYGSAFQDIFKYDFVRSLIK